MKEDPKNGSGLPGRALAFMILGALLAVVAAHAAQKLLISETSTAVTGGVATVIAVIVLLSQRKKRRMMLEPRGSRGLTAACSGRCCAPPLMLGVNPTK